MLLDLFQSIVGNLWNVLLKYLKTWIGMHTIQTCNAYTATYSPCLATLLNITAFVTSM